MLFEISCLIFKKKRKNPIFTFSKQSFLWILDFWLKTPKNYKNCSKNGPNHYLPYYLSHFIKKNPLFDIDLFSRTFDMESPLYGFEVQKLHMQRLEWAFWTVMLQKKSPKECNLRLTTRLLELLEAAKNTTVSIRLIG